jgi:hypothetical protein
MGKIGETLWDSTLFRRVLQRWALSAREAGTTRLSVLREQRNRARLLRAHLDRLIQTADERLAQPDRDPADFPRPHNADWAWRPAVWRGPLAVPGAAALAQKSPLDDDITLFHDCTQSEITLRQIRNLRPEDQTPYGIRLDVFRFDGSFLSLVFDLPEAALAGLKRSHILQVSGSIEMERPLQIFVRLNIRHGPNTEQILREMPLYSDDTSVEFDLAYANINESRIEKAWIDLLFDGPEMNQVTLRDLTFNRRPRAQL